MSVTSTEIWSIDTRPATILRPDGRAGTWRQRAGGPSQPVGVADRHGGHPALTGRRSRCGRSRSGVHGRATSVVHASNSAGLLCRTDAAYDLVRPGIAVYGLPRPGRARRRPAARAGLDVAGGPGPRPRPAGESVGYGHTWTAARPSRVATVPVGYADGLRRAPATWRHVLVRGGRRPLAGRVSMDQISVDVTEHRRRPPG